MPIQNIGSDIISAYLAGIAARERRESRIAKTEQQQAQLEEKKKEFDQQLKQHKEQFNAEQTLREADHKIQQIAHKVSIQKGLAESGLSLPGATETLTPNSTTQQDFEMLNQGTWNNPDLNKTQISIPSLTRNIQSPELGNLQIPDQATYLRQQADKARTLLQPKTEAAIQQATGIEKATRPGKVEMLTISEAAKLKRDEEKNKNAIELQKQKRQAAIDVQNLKNAGKGSGVKDRLLNDQEILQIPGAKMGDTVSMWRGAALNPKITPKEMEDVRTTNDIIADLTLVKNYGEKGMYELTNPISGTLKSFGARFGAGTPQEEEFRQSLAGVKKAIVTLQAGKVLAKNEEALISRYLPDLGAGALKSKVATEKLLNLMQRHNDQVLNPQAIVKQNPGTGPERRKFIDKSTGKEIERIKNPNGPGWIDAQ